MKGEDEMKKIITSKSKRRWVVERGVRLGRNVIMTAFFVSSAPLVLPPLIAISVFGFVVWVPVGVVVGSYAATEKLMSKLLPMPSSPSPPLLLEGCHHAATQVSADEDLARRDSEGRGECTDYEETKTSGEVVEGGESFVEGCEERSAFVRNEENYKADEVFQHLEGKHENRKATNVVDENLVVVDENENLDKGYDEEDDREYLKGEVGDKRRELEDADNVDENSEKEEDEEDACECTEGVRKGNAIDVILEEEGYMEEVGENFLEGEHEDDIHDEKLETGSEEVGESLEGEGDGKRIITIIDEDLKEEHYAKEVGGPLDGQNEDEIKDEILEKTSYDEEDFGECVEGEHEKEKEANTYKYLKKEGCDTKEATTSVSLKEGYHVKDINKNLDGERDVDLEKGYEEDVDECLEEEQGDVEEIPIEGDVKEEEKEDYMEEVDEYSDTKDENLEKDYKEHDVEYLGVEQGIGEVIHIDQTLEKGYEGEEEYLEVEQGDGKEITTDENMESGYEEEDEEYLEVEQGDGKVITTDETALDKGYGEDDDEEHIEGGEEGRKIDVTIDSNLKEDEEDVGKRLEGELEENKEISNDHSLKDESYGEEAIQQYLEGEEPEETATEMKIKGLLEVVSRRDSENNDDDNKVGNSEADHSFEEEDAKMDKSEEPAETIPTQDDITTETKKSIAGEDLKKHHVKKDQSLLINEENLVQEGVSSSTEEPQQKGSESSIDETETATANESTTLSDKGNAAVKQQDTPGGLHPSEHYVTKTNDGAQEPSSSEEGVRD
ncbi:unnamed protein product [Cuscuta epithymum]|uniref:Uncharacterized protein n=1 Tax=Cuscuta epithymum TaxID=186058 RepID=A0AAV0F334_9ASTE|nr:unnamed protein product [Cuscuta epithymum]